MSSKPVVVVFTANSNTGLATIEELVEKHADKVTIRGIVRKVQSGDQFQGMPVEVVQGDIVKPLMLGPVFKGANVAYFATPTTTNRVELGKKFIDACIENGVQYGIFISVIDAARQRTAYQRQFYEIEEYAKSKEGTPVKLSVGDKGKVKFSPIIIRTSLFYQNFYGSLAGIQAGTLYYPIGLLGKMAHVDLGDVARCIARILINPEPHAGKVYTLIGEIQAGNQIAAQIAMKASVGCTYLNVEDEIAVLAFQQLGLQPWIAEGLVELLQFMRAGVFDFPPTGDIEAITGAPATRFGDFVRDNIKPMLSM
eukprot:m.357095 g.357095  ORF g.357095 m.357095 type:complete len:310 (-) comp55965_c0_seq1:296-1225(-)